MCEVLYSMQNIVNRNWIISKILIIKFNYKYYIFGEKYFEPAN